MPNVLKWFDEAARWAALALGVWLVLYGLFARAPSGAVKHKNRGFLYLGLFALLPNSKLREFAGAELGSAIDLLLTFGALVALVLAFRSLGRSGESYEKPSA